jgi:hypothetical protein
MEDRLDALGGTMNIASSPGNGTMLRATVPLNDVVSKVFAEDTCTGQGPGRAFRCVSGRLTRFK